MVLAGHLVRSDGFVERHSADARTQAGQLVHPRRESMVPAGARTVQHEHVPHRVRGQVLQHGKHGGEPAPPLISTTGLSLASSSTKSPTGAWINRVSPSCTVSWRRLEITPSGEPSIGGVEVIQ